MGFSYSFLYKTTEKGGFSFSFALNVPTVVCCLNFFISQTSLRTLLTRARTTYKTPFCGVLLYILYKQRRRGDSNPRQSCPCTNVPGLHLKPLGHLSIDFKGFYFFSLYFRSFIVPLNFMWLF